MRRFMIAFVSALEIIALLFCLSPSTSAQDGMGSCCNLANTKDCSGCFPIDPGFVYVQLGSNTFYECQSYVNPITCSMSAQSCFYQAGPVQLYSNAGCTTKSGTETGFNRIVDQCPYDSCD